MSNYVEHFQYVVSDLEAAIRFYTFVFGWPVRGRGREIQTHRSYDWVHVGGEESYLAFRTPYNDQTFDDSMKNHPRSRLGVVAGDPAPILERLKELGVPVERSDGDAWSFRDFDDNEVRVSAGES
jgi:catechol 2,3-dioxygenase-like lactoylglutathione lyase family enzyme